MKHTQTTAASYCIVHWMFFLCTINCACLSLALNGKTVNSVGGLSNYFNVCRVRGSGMRCNNLWLNHAVFRFLICLPTNRMRVSTKRLRLFYTAFLSRQIVINYAISYNGRFDMAHDITFSSKYVAHMCNSHYALLSYYIHVRALRFTAAFISAVIYDMSLNESSCLSLSTCIALALKCS
jgi:hypothetical protein